MVTVLDFKISLAIVNMSDNNFNTFVFSLVSVVGLEHVFRIDVSSNSKRFEFRLKEHESESEWLYCQSKDVDIRVHSHCQQTQRFRWLLRRFCVSIVCTLQSLT